MDEEAFLKELRDTFLEEVEDILADIEGAFLTFEKNPGDLDILHEIFRYFHNIKGSSKTVGLNHLSHFAHNAENLLSKLRNQELAVTDAMVDTLLACADIMRLYTEGLKEDNEDYSALVAQAEKIAEFLDGGGGAPAETEAAAEPEPAPEPEDLGGFQSFEDDPPALPDPAPEVAGGEPEMAPGPQEAQEIASEGGDAVAAPVGEASPPVEAKKPKSDDKKASKAQEESIKVSMRKINDILDLFGEQVIIQSSLDHALERDGDNMEFITKSIGQLKKITQDLQHTMVTLRMVPLGTLFNRMERSVRDVARLTGKKVDFVKTGQTSELDKSIVDSLIDPLTHMVRNAVDHGLEDAEGRAKAGKSETGTVDLIAQRTGGTFEIIVRDDGKGLDPEKLIAKAEQKGLIKPGTKLTNQQAFELIFAGGFSTLETATEISGRGVGMDVVRQQIRSLKGTCTIDSQLGHGTVFTIRLPLSLAMFNGTVVGVSQQRYVVPNSDFNEALNIDVTKAGIEDGEANVFKHGNRVFRLIDMRKHLNAAGGSKVVGRIEPENGENRIAIVVSMDDQHYALLVDEILYQEQIVLKELGPEGKQIRGASGGTILGDGKVALVLDVHSIIKRVRFASRTKAA